MHQIIGEKAGMHQIIGGAHWPVGSKLERSKMMDPRHLHGLNTLLGQSSAQLRTEDDDVNELQGYFLNVTFVLIFVFAIATFAFRLHAAQEVKDAQGKQREAENRLEQIEGTPQGQAFVAMEKANDERDLAAADLQWEKLLRALDSAENKEREALGLSHFMRKSADQSVEFALEEVLANGRVSSDMSGKLFKAGCQEALSKLGEKGRLDALSQEWFAAVLAAAGIKADSLENSVQPGPELLLEKNRVKLEKEIQKRVGSLNTDTLALHEKAKSCMYDYLLQNSARVRDDSIRELLERYLTALQESSVGQSNSSSDILARIAPALNQYVMRVYSEQGAPLL
jgi:hypothetical protein